MHSLLRVSFTCAYVELRSSDLDFVGGRGRGGGVAALAPFSRASERLHTLLGCYFQARTSLSFMNVSGHAEGFPAIRSG